MLNLESSRLWCTYDPVDIDISGTLTIDKFEEVGSTEWKI